MKQVFCSEVSVFTAPAVLVSADENGTGAGKDGTSAREDTSCVLFTVIVQHPRNTYTPPPHPNQESLLVTQIQYTETSEPSRGERNLRVESETND